MDNRTAQTTTIDGFNVTLELFTEAGKARSECYIEKGAYSASLEAARDGTLTDARGNETKITERVLDRIDAWAEANGY